MDMKYQWLRCRISQEQFRHYWKAGKINLADYVTKHHPAIHHKATRGTFLTDISKLVELRSKQRDSAMKTLATNTRSKGVLDISGRPNSQSDYEKVLQTRKLLTRSIGGTMNIATRMDDKRCLSLNYYNNIIIYVY